VLLVTQSVFDEHNRPLPARLVILRPAEGAWTPEVIDDPDSNVFHKALGFETAGQGAGVLTIGADKAFLKFRWREGGAWKAATLWNPSFGGDHDRLRDLEIADVTGDGRPELLLATHDQGVVGVVREGDGGWQATELDRRPGIFVHEVEVGDVDGDGRAEFFTTPSRPNVAGAEAQGGGIDMYRWNGTAFERTPVMWSEGAHAKEILVADLDGDGRAGLWAVLEARTVAGADCTQQADMVPLRLVRYEPAGGTFAEREVATLPDCMCRFLAWGDADGDRRNEVVAAAKNAGVWLLRGAERAAWMPEIIDDDSGGFEHAALVADLDRNGTAEIYVAADKQGELRRYVWNAELGSFDRETIYGLGGAGITWNVTTAVLP
jgi:hypothetical protein